MNETERRGCSVDLPYPNTSTIRGSREQGKRISSAYAGMISEMTATNQYSYQHIVLKTSYPEISDTLLCIAETEMQHLQILGTLMENSGVDPRFADVSFGRERPWVSTHIRYIRDVQGMILQDISDEQEAIRQYERLISTLHNPMIAAVLRRIILDEQHHIEILSGIYAGLVTEQGKN